LAVFNIPLSPFKGGILQIYILQRGNSANVHPSKKEFIKHTLSK